MLRRLVIPVILLTAGCVTTPASSIEPKPVEVRVVVVTMFEIGADTGDAAGEFQLWHDRQKLDVRFAFAHHHDLFFNPSTGVLGMVTGEGSINSASAVMELGMDPRFDLSHAYSFQSLTYLHPTGKVNKDRVMVLRTASNYTMPPPGMSAAEHLLKENQGYAGLNASVEAAYRVGSVVVDEIVGKWSIYRDHTPPLTP